MTNAIERFVRAALPAVLLACGGCDAKPGTSPGDAAGSGSAAPAAVKHWQTPEEGHAALKAANPNYNGQAQLVFDGSILRVVDIKGTGIVNLAPLAGQKLEVLFAEENPLTDLRRCAGCG
ncbi:MAG: hypothetical protein QM775_23045 [Pirellulales bacterium]